MYLLFAGNEYYPDGGIHDLQDTSDDLENLKLHMRAWAEEFSWAHIYCTETLQIVAEIK